MKWDPSSLKWPLLVVTAAAWIVIVAMTVHNPDEMTEPPAPCCNFVLLAFLITTTGMIWQRKPMCPFNHCQQCDYDLTGNISGVCPECGKTVPTQQELEAQAEASRRRHVMVRESVVLVLALLVGVHWVWSVMEALCRDLGLRRMIGNAMPSFILLILLVAVYIDQRRRR